MTTTSLIMGAGCKMLIRSIALAAALFIPTNFVGQEPVKVERVTVIYRDAGPIVWEAPAIRARSPGPEVWDVPAVMAEIIIPRAKPEKPKPDTRKCRKGEKIWRTLPNGHRKYRLRRTC